MTKSIIQWLNRSESAKWVLADQIMVSALNFITSILLVRFMGIEVYGRFVLSYSALLYANTLQQALIIAPILSIAPKLDDSEKKRYLKGMLSLQIALSTLLGAVIFVLAGSFSYFAPTSNLLPDGFSLSSSIFFFQLQDWLRRYYFLSQKGRSAFINDAMSYGGQVLVMTILFKIEALTVSTTFWAIALTSAFASLVGIFIEKLYPLRQQMLQDFRKNWKFSFNLLLAGQINWIGSQGILVLSGVVLGTEALGGLRAAQNIAGPLNILFQGMENFVPIKASQRYAQAQLKGLCDFLLKVCWVGGIILGIPCAIIAIFSKDLMVLAYGKTYSEYSHLVIWQLAVCLVIFFCLQGFYFFRTIDKTQQILFGSMISSSIAVIATVMLGSLLGSTGVMVATLLAQLGYIFYFALVISKYLRSEAMKIRS